MTAHRNGWRLRAGLVVALVAGVIGVAVPSAAYAAGPTVTLSASSIELQPGQSKQITVTVTSNLPATLDFKVSLSGLDPDVTMACSGSGFSGSCGNGSLTVTADSAQTVTINFTAKSQVSVDPGSTETGNGSVSVQGASDKNFSVKLDGPAQAADTVGTISGTVKDSATGKGIAGATVILQDVTNTEFTTKSGIAGNYSFTSTPQKPIKAGQMAILAQADGYTYDAHPFNASIGQNTTFDIVMISTASPTASASDPSALPSDTGIVSAPAVTPEAAGGGSSNHYLLFMIIAGAVLIIAGIGAIVTLMVRRRGEDDEEDEDEDDRRPPPRRGPPPGRGPGGGYRADPTAVVARDPGYNDRTAVVARPPLDDEYPDPYGAPPPRSPAPAYGGGGQYGGREPQRPGYGGGQYGGGAGSGYDAPTTYTPAARPPADPYATGAGSYA
ncbi:MAG TPA: carboxypeptidase-like regulatory domain-containing protein, partial [Rugosimonospora sp.]|nr:carboxypeptidase-like regulatory domain-containing protein [Rugosimonospora sp.]